MSEFIPHQQLTHLKAVGDMLRGEQMPRFSWKFQLFEGGKGSDEWIESLDLALTADGEPILYLAFGDGQLAVLAYVVNKREGELL